MLKPPKQKGALTMQTVIETKSLCKQYGTRMAVDHVELHVP